MQRAVLFCVVALYDALQRGRWMLGTQA